MSIQKQYEEILPNPKNLMHSLRDIGYSLETAIADIIDNSIAANATSIHIFAHYDLHKSYIAIVDNGCGMSEEKLSKAMKLGSLDPVLARNSKDLGRFGLGLKTASFSQAGKLSVVSVRDGAMYGRRWDMQHVSETEKWEIEILNAEQFKDIFKIDMLSNHGTLVLWEQLYRLIDINGKRDPQDLFWEKIENTRQHLSLVFHRYISGEPGLSKVNIEINRDPLAPFNPFEGAGKPFPEENFNNIRMQAYLLPHHSKTTPEQYRRLSGPEGYLRSQGFYVYRNARLLISGTWFRLLRLSEATKLARIQIDLPNSEDFSWSIDVKKSQASPPETIRLELKRTIEKITSQATRVYTKRGKKISSSSLVPIWQEHHQHNKKSYKINNENPLLQNFIKELNDNQKSTFKIVLDVIENGLPIDTIYADMIHEPENIQQKDIECEVLKKSAENYWKMMKQLGVPEEIIAERMLQNEPFSKYESFCDSFIKSKTKENNNG